MVAHTWCDISFNRWISVCISICVCLVATLGIHGGVYADVSQLVRSGNGFLYDIPKVTELELEINNEFPNGEEFPQDAIPVAPSDIELGVEEAVGESTNIEPVVQTKESPHRHLHGYEYVVPQRRFKT